MLIKHDNQAQNINSNLCTYSVIHYFRILKVQKHLLKKLQESMKLWLSM